MFRGLDSSFSLLLPLRLCVAVLIAVMLLPLTAWWNSLHFRFLSHCCLVPSLPPRKSVW